MIYTVFFFSLGGGDVTFIVFHYYYFSSRLHILSFLHIYHKVTGFLNILFDVIKILG